jgi:ribosomal protein S4
MQHPGYLLNPGDLFSVEPELVLYATGARKEVEQSRIGRRIKRKAKAHATTEDETSETGEGAKQTPVKATTKTYEIEDEPSLEELTEALTIEVPGDAISDVKELIKVSRNVIAKIDESELSAKRKQHVRKFRKHLRNFISTANKTTPEQLENMKKALKSVEDLRLTATSQSRAVATLRSVADLPSISDDLSDLSPREIKAVFERRAELKRKERENPVDPRKPYATPWRPRPWMAPFVFIPKYLEVNQNICSAVYLRHPVARPGNAEVPSPFPQEINQLAFTWYLRRR